MPNPGQHFDARPDGNGGVKLTMKRRTFPDAPAEFLPGSKFSPRGNDDEMMGSFLGEDGIARARPVRDQDDGEKVAQTLFVFGPMTEGQSYKFQKMANGCIAVVLMSDPAELIGNTITSGKGTINTSLNEGPTKAAAMDAAARSISVGRGNEPKKLRTLNAINRAHFKR